MTKRKSAASTSTDKQITKKRGRDERSVIEAPEIVSDDTTKTKPTPVTIALVSNATYNLVEGKRVLSNSSVKQHDWPHCYAPVPPLKTKKSGESQQTHEEKSKPSKKKKTTPKPSTGTRKDPKWMITELSQQQQQSIVSKTFNLKPFRVMHKLIAQSSRLEFHLPSQDMEPLRCRLFQGIGKDERLLAAFVIGHSLPF